MTRYEAVLLCARPPALAEVEPDGEVGPAPEPATLAAALEHARAWPEAGQALAGVRAALTLHDPLPAPERLPALVARVQAAVERHRPLALAVWWRPADKLVNPAALAGADPFDLAVQLRFFHVEEGRPGEHVIDTLGLGALGLVDVQCHFVGLRPDAVAELVARTARYLYEEDADIADGDTVPGLDGVAWPCGREEALVAPARDVVDLRPPAPHHAR